MATNDKILESRIIGFIEPLSYTENARVTPIGFKNEIGDYEVLGKNQAKSIFYPEGKIFAPKFQFDKEGYSISPNSFIEFNVRTSLKDASFKGDDYIIDYRKKCIQKTFTSIITVNYQTSLESGFITQDEFFSCIDKNDLKNISGIFFLKYKNCLYGLFKYESSTDTVRPVTGKEANIYEIDSAIYEEKCIPFNQREYYLGNINPLPFRNVGIIDCMDDKQLGEWFKKQLKVCAETEKITSLKKRLSKILQRYLKKQMMRLMK